MQQLARSLSWRVLKVASIPIRTAHAIKRPYSNYHAPLTTFSEEEQLMKDAGTYFILFYLLPVIVGLRRVESYLCVV